MLSWIRTQPQHADGPPEKAGEQDADLVASARADRRAFAPLYARYLEPVYRYCYRRLGSQHAAEDATGEVFYRALAALPGYQDGSFRAWLFSIAHNVVADNLRRRPPEEPLAPDYDPPDGASTPEQLALVAEERRSLRTLLARLPSEQQSVMELRLAGLTGAEIATALGRSLGSVSRWSLLSSQYRVGTLRSPIPRCQPWRLPPRAPRRPQSRRRSSRSYVLHGCRSR